MNIAALVFDVARRQGDRPAVSDGFHHWSYREFARRVAALAGGLARRGLGRGERVMLCMENCAEFLEALFACWTTGLCAVPTNARLHPSEVEYIARDSGARLILATPALAEGLMPLKHSVETLAAVIATRSEDYAALAAGEPVFPAAGAPADRAWLFYTSGTTGRPKGAVLTHRNLLFMSHCYYADIDRLDARDTMLHAAPLSHGSGLYALPHLLQGGHQVVLPGFDSDAILEALARHRQVSMFAAPTMLIRLVRTLEARPANLGNLRTIAYGGGPMYVPDLERALALFGPRLYQLYGQGESPMTITGLTQQMHQEAVAQGRRDRLGSCGVPRTGVLVKIVDEEGRTLPPGAIGEVATRSDCVMAEYWRNPAADAETLRDGWLYTGDLGSLDEEGFLTLRDRSKDMIISGGSNIYPREIEEVLLRHSDLVEAAVVGRPHPEWGEEVVAFVVPRPGAAVEAAALDRLCLSQIARYKRPRDYRFVDVLPKNNYGKVVKTELRRLLAQPGREP
ncbi:MAG TPA: AMP-binding protein [Stellaceae bacterium]|nr:AMP-binding protein [Stellaceae bacterium]